MPYMLYTKSLDDDPETRTFDTEELAIDAAKQWFADGYDNDTTDQITKDNLPDDLKELEADLRSTGNFYCSRFYETIILKKV